MNNPNYVMGTIVSFAMYVSGEFANISALIDWVKLVAISNNVMKINRVSVLYHDVNENTYAVHVELLPVKQVYTDDEFAEIAYEILISAMDFDCNYLFPINGKHCNTRLIYNSVCQKSVFVNINTNAVVYPTETIY